MPRSRTHVPCGTRTCLTAAIVATLLASGLSAQSTTPKVYYACYVPGSGTVYRIKEPNTPPSCQSNVHVQFSWTDAAGADHGALSGLGDDDHKQYLLANGAREAPNGFAVTGTLFSGALVASGPGPRVLWYPRMGAFRAGAVFQAQWDAANIGEVSTAFGYNTTASGFRSTALGAATVASGSQSIAMGAGTTASGQISTAMGALTTASGENSTAMGGSTIASGQYSTAMGLLTRATGQSSTAIGSGAVAAGLVSTAIGHGVTADGDRSTAMGILSSTNGHAGAFVYGDLSTLFTREVVKNNADNQFMVRATGGTIFYSSSDLSAGVSLAPGAGAWASVSDVNRKENFRDVDGEDVLAKISAMPIREWNYKAQDDSIRHLGPSAQDFRAAFGLGESNTTITTTDIDGVALLASQALVRRTELLDRENKKLRADITAVSTELAAVRQALDALRSAIAATGAPAKR